MVSARVVDEHVVAVWRRDGGSEVPLCRAELGAYQAGGTVPTGVMRLDSSPGSHERRTCHGRRGGSAYVGGAAGGGRKVARERGNWLWKHRRGRWRRDYPTGREQSRNPASFNVCHGCGHTAMTSVLPRVLFETATRIRSLGVWLQLRIPP
jgi:hypothetical protein